MNKKKQLASYRAKTNEISKKLSVNNQKFFEDFREYLLFSSVFYDEYTVVVQVYEIANDLLEAQNQGEEAQEYFGTNPQEIADELLRNTPKSSFADHLFLLYIIIGISWLIKLINDFSSNSVLQLNLFSYVTTAMYSIFIVILFFFGMKKTIYLKKSFIANKTKRFLILWLVALLWIGGSVLLSLFTPDIWLVTISFPMDAVLMILLLIVIWLVTYLKGGKEFYPFNFMLSIFVGLGMPQRWEPEFWNKGIVIFSLSISFVIYILWTIYITKKSDKE